MMKSINKHLVIMAAGTGGHVIPGLAVAAEMQKRGWQVSWLGTTHGMENKLVPPSGLAMDSIAFSGLRGKGLMHSFTGVFRLVGALVSCFKILRARRPQVVLGMGGYVCFPGGLMAGLLRKPLMLVNADAALLMSNKSLLRVASKVGFGFDGESAKKTKNALVTGNPVRPDIEALPSPGARFVNREGPLRLLVVGGSLGAQVLNQTLPEAICLLPLDKRPLIIHQTGAAQCAAVQAAYEALGLQAQVLPFIDNMAEQLAQCDLIVCRAGAITVSELCAAGVASILVPLVISTTSHQRDNALWMERQSAGIHLPQKDLTPRRLADIINGISRHQLLRLAAQARTLARPYAAQRVADELEKIAP
jgi:UDP-N-acetylglucosamine--N-acetylmuramyl-(pentapeptide) pyrophosphoryl-undecaprenol N-acetylglucosamine transferase